MTHVLQITEGPLQGCFLQGPRTPSKVRRLGYAFTNSIEEAWPFDTPGKASRKRQTVVKHMSWPLDKLAIVTSA